MTLRDIFFNLTKKNDVIFEDFGHPMVKKYFFIFFYLANGCVFSEKKPFGSITISFKVIIKNQNKILLENFENI